ncbi:hypothetical protein [Lihuaxuella thermophila]|uniref:Uncharacterized protein n=1 Tax=Lihuaxuella thermophila TaxID=1173111 RepID=A0A1H8CJN3_9BACL|nr:hypothetical protein [Lihuaxuella thermophila]SEM94634.1 hypothetical protein SAMN05444955_103316 [Lihuaxuella thermophila]
MKADATSIPSAYQQAVLRWKQGHQIFHVLLVVMNTALEVSLDSVRHRDWSCVSSSLQRLTVLFNASTAVMKYSADFPRHLYEDLIRPSMMPPFLSPGFSGQLNTEHHVMLENFRNLRTMLMKELGEVQQWPADLAKAWTSLVKSQVYNRKHHGLVCQKFVDGGTSLLREFYANKPDLSKE